MTKMHFDRLAKAVRAMRDTYVEGELVHFTDQQMEVIRDQLALVCSEFNQRFDYGRFEDACNR